MNVFRGCLLAALLLAPWAASADPVGDPTVWTQRSIEQAVKDDVDGMSALLSGGAAAGLNTGIFKAGVQSLLKSKGSSMAQSAESFNEVDVGTFVKRINVAVIYPTSYLFYSFSWGRHEEGWYIYNYKVGGNLNEILNAPWPG